MCSPFTQLPAELWTLVFGHLSLVDRLRVRATCKYFKELVDSIAVSKDFTLALKRSTERYTQHFWHTLRRWKVTSAHLYFTFGWKRIAEELPGLTSLTLNYKTLHADLLGLHSFPNLERLFISEESGKRICLDELCLLPERLTHLSVCQYKKYWDYVLLPADLSDPGLPFKKLKSLVCHCAFLSDPVDVLYYFLCACPQLEHISLALGYMYGTFEGHMPDLRPLRTCALTSVEFVECDLGTLPKDFQVMLSALPCLRSLAIFCHHDYDFFTEVPDSLCVWLEGLPALSSLLVRGVEVARFVESIPSSVTRVTLMPKRIVVAELRALAAQLPDLIHLHLETHGALLRNIPLIPQLFPRLRSLRIPLKLKPLPSSKRRKQPRVPESAFLSLASLKELEVLEVQDERPPPAALVSKFQALTKNRVRVSQRPEADQLQSSCRCMTNIGCRPTNSWDKV